ncbi:MAG TPA: SAP domain-containing protein [Actinomycetes bacterium]|nr:SAP domain-containing protein [Actinomycetes bacterium]
MVRKRNVSGEALNVPALGTPGAPRAVEADEIIDVDEDLAAGLSPELWADVSDDDVTVDELKAQLRDRGLPVSGTKAELQARLDQAAASDNQQPGQGGGE